MHIYRNRIWVGLFGIWLFLLSGSMSHWFGSPGGLQALKLRTLLAERQREFARMQTEVAKLEFDVDQLEHNPIAQQREIREVLGYVGPKDLVFDFVQ